MSVPDPSVTTATENRIDLWARRLQLIGWVATLLCFLLIVATLVLDFAIYRTLVVNGQLSFSQINQIVTVIAIVAPVLAVIGVLSTIAGGWRLVRQLRQQVATFPKGTETSVFTRLRAGARIAQTCSALMLVGSTAFGIATATGATYHTTANSYHLETETHSNCQWATGEPITCTLVITSASQSNVTFDWVGESNPAGAVFSPSSGSIAPGQSSPPITVTDDVACPIYFNFVDQTHGLQVQSYFNAACQDG